MSLKPSRRTPAVEVRTNLLGAAQRILERDGAAALTVRSVATEAGVAPMGVYNHFDGKDGLLTALASRGFDELAIATGARDDDPAARLFASGRGYRRFAMDNPQVYQLMFSGGCEPAMESASAAFDVLAEILRYGQAAQLVRPGNADEIAMQVWSTVHGAVSLELAGAHPPHLDLAQIYEDLLDMIARGLAVDRRGTD